LSNVVETAAFTSDKMVATTIQNLINMFFFKEKNINKLLSHNDYRWFGFVDFKTILLPQKYCTSVDSPVRGEG
jgi:hypothetical protein